MWVDIVYWGLGMVRFGRCGMYFSWFYWCGCCYLGLWVEWGWEWVGGFYIDFGMDYFGWYCGWVLDLFFYNGDNYFFEFFLVLLFMFWFINYNFCLDEYIWIVKMIVWRKMLEVLFCVSIMYGNVFVLSFYWFSEVVVRCRVDRVM